MINKKMNKFLRFIYFKLVNILTQIIAYFGYELDVNISKKLPSNNKLEINLNIGAGSYIIQGFKSLDFYSEHYYPDKNKFLKERINYDIRHDYIPSKDNSIDNIYISHVIEHIEDEYVSKFINDAYRVLKPGGVIRIVCPDSKFIFEVSQFQNQFWTWRHRLFYDKDQYTTDWDSIESYDFLMRELSTPNCRYYNNKIDRDNFDLDRLKNLNFKDFTSLVKQNLAFRSAYPGDHISIWDFDTLKQLGTAAGFSHIIDSKRFGSVSLTMQSRKFDKVGPQMSLYVDMVK